MCRQAAARERARRTASMVREPLAMPPKPPPRATMTVPSLSVDLDCESQEVSHQAGCTIPLGFAACFPASRQERPASECLSAQPADDRDAMDATCMIYCQAQCNSNLHQTVSHKVKKGSELLQQGSSNSRSTAGHQLGSHAASAALHAPGAARDAIPRSHVASLQCA